MSSKLTKLTGLWGNCGARVFHSDNSCDQTEVWNNRKWILGRWAATVAACSSSQGEAPSFSSAWLCSVNVGFGSVEMLPVNFGDSRFTFLSVCFFFFLQLVWKRDFRMLCIWSWFAVLVDGKLIVSVCIIQFLSICAPSRLLYASPPVRAVLQLILCVWKKEKTCKQMRKDPGCNS